MQIQNGRKRPYVNQGKKALFNVFKQSATLTSQANFADQMAHIQFQKQSVRTKQIKALLDEFPEHFIVNEGKDAKKFTSDNSVTQVSALLPPIYCCWPSLALRMTEQAEIGLNPLLQGILLASCRYNNRNKTFSVVDQYAGIMQLEQEAFKLSKVEFSWPAFFTFYFMPESLQVKSSVLNWSYMHLLTAPNGLNSLPSTDPTHYLFDHVTPVDMNVQGPYSFDVDDTTQYEMVSLIVVAYMQVVKLLEMAGVIPLERYQEDATPDSLRDIAVKVCKYISKQQDSAGYDSRLLSSERGKVYFSTMHEFLKLSVFLYDGLLDLQSKKGVDLFAGVFTMHVDLLKLQWEALHENEERFNLEVLFQIQGLTRTSGFGLLHVDTGLTHSQKAMGVIGVTPESREYLQLVANVDRSLPSQMLYPSTTQLVLYDDFRVEDKQAALWKMSGAPLDTANRRLSQKNFGLALQELTDIPSSSLQDYLAECIREWLVDLQSQEVFQKVSAKEFYEHQTLILSLKGRLKNMKRTPLKTVETRNDIRRFYSSLGILSSYAKRQEKQLARKKVLIKELISPGRNFEGFLLARQQVCNYSVYDRATLMRSTQDFMEQEATFFNMGYSKLSSSVALTVQCATNTYQSWNSSSVVQGNWNVMVQQSKVLAETFSGRRQPEYEKELTYGEMISTFLMNSQETMARDNMQQFNSRDLIDSVKSIHYYDSLASVNETFCSYPPTMFAVRYNQDRMKDDQKIYKQDDGLTNMTDRLIFMEPSASFVDTFALHKLLDAVDRFLDVLVLKQEENKNADVDMQEDPRTKADILEMLFAMDTDLFKQECQNLHPEYVYNTPMFGQTIDTTDYVSHSVQLKTDIESAKAEYSAAFIQGIDGQGMAIDSELAIKAKILEQPDGIFLFKCYASLATLLESVDAADFAEVPQKLPLVSRREQLRVLQSTRIAVDDWRAQLVLPSYLSISDRLTFKTPKLSVDDQTKFVSVTDYVQVNVKNYGLTTYRPESHQKPVAPYKFDRLRDLFLPYAGDYVETLDDEAVVQLASFVKLLHQFRLPELSLTVEQVIDFLRKVATSEPTSTKRFLVRLEQPKQRVAFADYIESMSVVSFSSGLTATGFKFKLQDSVKEFVANFPQNPYKLLSQPQNVMSFLQEGISVSIDPSLVYYQPQYFQLDGKNVPSLKIPPFKPVGKKFDIFLGLDFVHVNDDTNDQFQSRPQWSVKAGTTYTRKSVTPGLQLLRLKRDPVDQLAINHPTVRVASKKTLQQSYMYRDVLVHMSSLQPVDQALLLVEPEFGTFRNKESKQVHQLPEFNSKTTELYVSSFISDRIMKLLGSLNIQTPGITSQYQRHVGVPFYTPLTRFQILNNAARGFQVLFAQTDYFGGHAAYKLLNHSIVQEIPVLGAIYNNVVPILKDDETFVIVGRFTKNWVDMFNFFLQNCVPKLKEDLELIRQYQSRYTLKADSKKWADNFPIARLESRQNYLDLDFNFAMRLEHTGLLRARYIMQATYWDFSVLFEAEYKSKPQTDLKQLFASASVYKENLAKYLTSLKFTIGIYPDNPFLIESFAQVYFQGYRQKTVGDTLIQLKNPKVADFYDSAKPLGDTLMVYSTSYDVRQSLTAVDVKFQHLLLSVFAEQLLVRQGCPVDPFVVMKDYITEKRLSFDSLISQTFKDNDNNKKIREIAARAQAVMGTVGQGNLKYAEAIKQEFLLLKQREIFNLSSPHQHSFWDQYQSKFVGDPQLLFEVFMETFFLDAGSANTGYVLQKVVNYRQTKYNLDVKVAQKICPQFCTFKDPQTNHQGFNPRATLIDAAIYSLKHLFIKAEKPTFQTHTKAKDTLVQIVKDISELTQFISSLFTLHVSAYSRGQTKGTKDSENFQMIKMVQMYGEELHTSLSLITEMLEQEMIEKNFYYLPPYVPQPVAPGGQAAVQPSDEERFNAYIVGKQPDMPIFGEEQRLKILKVFRSLKEALLAMTLFELYEPRVSQTDAMQQLNRSVNEDAIKYQSGVLRDTSTMLLRTVISSANVYGYFKAKGIIALHGEVMQMVQQILKQNFTGLQFIETRYICKDSEVSTLKIMSIPGALFDDYNLEARRLNAFDYNEFSKRYRDTITTEVSQKMMIWALIQKRLTELVDYRPPLQAAEIQQLNSAYFTYPFRDAIRLERSKWDQVAKEAIDSLFKDQ